MHVGDISNTLVLQAINISKLVHSVDFKPTDDAQLHVDLIDTMNHFAATLETFAKELNKLMEGMWKE